MEYAIAMDRWTRCFDDWETSYYYGIASLFGEKEQYMYPCQESYSMWRSNLIQVLYFAVGLDIFCVYDIVEEMDEFGLFDFY